MLDSKCTSNTIALANYNVSLIPCCAGNINYTEIVISDSNRGYRIWNFKLGADNLVNPNFTLVFNLNPNCLLPNNKDFVKISQINFNGYIQGTIIVNNNVIGITNNPQILNYSFNPIQGVFSLTINLSNYCTFWNKMGNNYIYANLTLKDP
jgi:hypothetical protein